MAGKRPISSRVWVYKPDFYFHRKSPVWFGDDEYHWKTLVIGWNITGQFVIALRPFTKKECKDIGCWDLDSWMQGYPGWPIKMHDWPLPRVHSPNECGDPSDCYWHSEAWHVSQGCTCTWGETSGVWPSKMKEGCPAPYHGPI